MIHDVDIDDIVQIVASDEKLFRYIMKLVKNRLPRSTRKDKEWCTKVIDLSIQSALQEVRVIDIVKNMAEQQRLQQQYNEEDDNDILLTQISSDSEDERVAIAPIDDDEQYYNNLPQCSQPYEEDNDERISEANNNIYFSNSFPLNNSNIDNEDSALRPHFSDNEPSTVSINSPKRVLRNLNKYKNLPRNDEDHEPAMSLEIETDNLQARNELEGNSDVIDINESIESRAESEASTVQVTLQPNLSSSLQQDWDENEDELDSEEIRRSHAKASLTYDSDIDIDEKLETTNLEHDDEDFIVPHGGMSQRYSHKNISVSNNNEQSLSPLPQDILHNANDDEDDVLLGDSARQSREQLHERDDLHNGSETMKDLTTDENSYSHENDTNEDLEAWERKVIDNIRKEREDIMDKDDDQSHASFTNLSPDENEEIYVVHSSTMLSQTTNKSLLDDVHASSSPHQNTELHHLHTNSLSSAGSPCSTASPDRLKTRVPNRNILTHQTSPSHPGAFYPESNQNSAEKSTHHSPASQKTSVSSASPHKSPNYHHDQDNEINEEEYSFTDFAADSSQLSHRGGIINSTEKHHKDENESDAEDDYEDDYEENVEDETANQFNQSQHQDITVSDVRDDRSPTGYTVDINSKNSLPVITSTVMKTPGSTKGAKKKVFFSDNVVSNVFYRDRVDPLEKKILFYAHEDEWRFGEDQSREMAEAERMGLTWAEWVEKYHHDHDDGLGNYGKRTIASNIKGNPTSYTNRNTNDNRKMDLYTSGDDEFEMAEEDSDGLYDFEYDEDF